MSRYTFGGGIADWTFEAASGGLVRLGSATVTFWDASTGGTHSDHLLLDGDAVTSIDSDADGQLPESPPTAYRRCGRRPAGRG